MNKYICDTMALILRLEKRRMPQRIREVFEEAENGEVTILIPAIVFAEIAYLSEKSKIETNLYEVKKYIHKHSTISETPIMLSSVEQAFLIDDIPELHDRLIAGSGKAMNASILTNDPEISDSVHVRSIWK